MDKFFKGLEINRESRLDAVRRLLENFNQNTLPKINEASRINQNTALPLFRWKYCLQLFQT